MKIKRFLITLGPVVFVVVLITLLPPSARSQGPLNPSGAPAPAMKSLQEIWDKLEEVESRVTALQSGGLGPNFPLEFVEVTDAGNLADTSGNPNPAGAVSYAYRIGKYEVTNAQYAEFLNAVGAADPNGIYNPIMGSGVQGGIVRAGSSPNHTYSVKVAMEDKPVVGPSWYDALRFCNWLHNGRAGGAQGNGTTEGGAYTLTGPTTIQLPGSDPVHGANGRNAGAKFHLPGEDEWYKAAYHQIVLQGGDPGNYWLYPTGSNTAPTKATADARGDIDNDMANIANYDTGAYWNGVSGNVTTVGSGGPGSASFYGACDMAGNVMEWTEQSSGAERVIRGGSWFNPGSFQEATNRFTWDPTGELDVFGFRVARP